MTTLPQDDRSPLPHVDDASAPHWDGLARGVLTLRRCTVCRALNHPAAEECRVCENIPLEWVDIGREVRLYSWTVEVRPVVQGMRPPYVVGQVTPAECEDGDVRLVGTLLADPERLELGMPLLLQPVMAPGSERHLAVYVPA
ncbi:Zn-ribbon domain-containing OB-fold protein [Nocardioides caldifontis]|uniref:Zn-ribbon domain-containing OB-fold protein n=1 Tax=Nocardioides caldifontis TaxID=2588938 RepID=UPI0011DF62A9|nr:OB-fold domain-containing protein [Nocardioides caldifontis]